LLLKKPGKLATKLSAEGFGKELGQERGPGLGIDSGKEQSSLSGKVSGKELSSLLVT
jgi:hypothetical protein